MAASMHILMQCIVVVIDFVALLIAALTDFAALRMVDFMTCIMLRTAAVTDFAIFCIVAVINLVMLCGTAVTELSCCAWLQ